jgi:glycosyltransferase involved in cell wall biosynthesis
MKILYYLPVKKRYISKWDFYKPDIDALNETEELKVVNTFLEFIYNFLFYDLVFCMWWHRSVVPIFISRIFKKKVICSGAIHFKDNSGEKTWFNSSKIYRITNLISLKLTNYNIFVSKQQFRDFKKILGIKNGYLLTLKINKSLEKKLNTKYPKKISKKKKLILTSILWQTKSSYKRKGLFETIDAVHLLKKKGIKFEFNIIGEKGDGINLLKKIIAAKELKKEINIITNINQKAKINLLQKTHLYVQPSFCEAFSYAVLEASAAGVLSLIGLKTAQREIVLDNGYGVSSIKKNFIYNEIIKYLALTKKKEIIKIKNLKNHINKNYSFKQHKKEMKNLLSIL